jgi:hypothetical protein
VSEMTLWIPAGPGEMFAPGAFDHRIGTTIGVNLGSFGDQGTLIHAEVAEDGSGARLTLELAEVPA